MGKVIKTISISAPEQAAPRGGPWVDCQPLGAIPAEQPAVCTEAVQRKLAAAAILPRDGDTHQGRSFIVLLSILCGYTNQAR